jgi:hypothetical protein
MGVVDYPNGISSFGIPLMGTLPIASTQGKVLHVKPYSGSDGNKGNNPKKALKTLSKALSLATADKNDIVLMYTEGNSAAATSDYQAVALDWNKDGVHLLGVGANPMIGQRARIAQLSTVKSIEDLFTVSANNCIIANIGVYQGVATSVATAPRAVVVSGQRNKIVNCQLSGMGDTSMDLTTARSLTVSGSENEFFGCYIGLDTAIRATNLIEVGVTGTAAAKATRNIFKKCIFATWNSNTTSKLLAVSYVDRFLYLEDCIFYSAAGITSAATPTGAISTANMNGRVLIYGGGVFGPADVTTADDTNIFMLTHSGLAANVVDQGVAKATDVAA